MLCRFLVLIFTIGSCMLNAQANPCEKPQEIISTIASTFSKLEPETSIRIADSILLEVKNLDCPESLLDVYLVKGRYAKHIGQKDSALVYYNRSLEYAAKTHNYLRQKDIYVLISVLIQETESNLKAIEYLDNAFELPCHSDLKKCQKTNVKIIINKASFLRQKQSYSEAIDNFKKADSLIIAYNIPDSIYKVSVYNSVANIYEEQQDIEHSLLWHQRALHYCPKNHSARFSLFNNIGHRYKKLNETDSAILYYNKTLESTDHKRFRVTPYQGIGDIAYELKDSKGAIRAYSKALENAEASNIVSYISGSAGLLGKAYYLDGQYDLAKKYMKKFKNSMDPDNTLLEDKVELERYMLLNELKNKSTSLHISAERLFEQRDSLFDLDRKDAIAKMTSRYENRILSDSLVTLKLENKNSLLESKVSKLFNVISLLALSVLGFLGFLLVNRYKKQKIINENLVFEKSELKVINARLKTQLEKNEIQEKGQDAMSSNPIIEPERIEIKSTDKTHFIDVKSIMYFSAEDNGVRIYLENDNSLWSDIRLKALEDQLLGINFIKIFRSTVVNFQHVDWVNHSSLMMLNGTELKIGRTYKTNIKQRFQK